MNHQAPLRVATIAMVEMAHGTPFGDEDLWRLLVLDSGEFQLARVRSYLTILVRCKALACMGRGWSGSRFRPGRRWQQWCNGEPRSALGGNDANYVASRATIDRMHDTWRTFEARIRQRIHDERIRKGLGYREFAAKIGMHIGHLHRLEHGSSDSKRAVSLPVLIRVAIALDMSLDDLVDWKGVRASVAAEQPMTAAVP